MPRRSSSHRLDVAVLMGGMSPEHDVSLSSGRMVVEALDRDRYRIWPVVLERTGSWLFPASPDGPIPATADDGVVRLSVGSALDRLASTVEIAFLSLHGPFGEDGTLQGMLELAGMAYTGSGVLASSLAMDKERSLWVFRHHGLPTPAGACLERDAWRSGGGALPASLEEVSCPWVVKPVDQGSSVGIHMVDGPEALPSVLDDAFSHSSRILVEERIQGDELTCGILEDPEGGRPLALPVTLIRPKEDAFFDYHAKYTPGATEELTPAPIDDTLRDRIQEVSLQAFEILGCEGMARFDFMVGDGRPYLLEGNTIPGMTPTSLLPQAAEAAGLSFGALLDRLIRCGQARARRRGSGASE